MTLPQPSTNGGKSRSSRPSRRLLERAYTSREAAEVTGVPFFTIDYWGRTKFLEPTVAKGAGRGKGRQRMYSYGDLIRLRIARELREQNVSLETLRALIHKLGPVSQELSRARYVVVGEEVEIAESFAELTSLLRRPGRRTFGMLLDLGALLANVRSEARRLLASPPVSPASPGE
ncbi:MAG TPA: MerR family transcriptional regulator [Thermoanaerobaculia bacterium]|nr:MerR family transcriptional regulator [Thermoanaerobaculia bacterium]